MVTVVTHVPLKEGTEHEWDALMAERMAAAKKQPGWVGGQLLRSPNGRVIVAPGRHATTGPSDRPTPAGTRSCSK